MLHKSDTDKSTNSDSTKSKTVEWCIGCLGINVPKGYSSAEAVASADSMQVAWTVWAVIFLFVGTVLSFFGVALLTLSMAFIGLLMGFIPFFFIGCGIFSPGGGQWGAVGVGAVFGVILMGLILYFRFVGHVCVGAAGGLALALQLNGWILHFVYNAVGGDAAHWIPIVVNLSLAVLGGLLIFCDCSKKKVLLLTTAFCGSYMLVWGALQLVMLAMGDHNKDTLAVVMNPVVLFAGQREDSWQIYVGLACVLIAGVFASIIQFKYTEEMECFGGKLGPKTGDPGYEVPPGYNDLKRGVFAKDGL